MYELYWAARTGAFVVHAALQEAETAHDLLIVDRKDKSDVFLEINPMAEVPVLILPDRSIMTESTAMVIHLAERFPDHGLLPEPGSSARATAYRWLLYMATNTYVANQRMYYSARYTTRSEHVGEVRQAAIRDLDSSFDFLDRVLADHAFLAGEQISIVDTYLVMLSMWHPDLSALMARCRNVERIVTAVRARPAIQQIWAQNFPDRV